MCRLWILLVMNCIIVDFVVAPEGAFTWMECNELCNKNHGYIVTEPGVLIPLTRPFVSSDGSSCDCSLYYAELTPFLRGKELDHESFYNWYNKAACFGRIWLTWYGIKVVFSTQYRSNFSENRRSLPDTNKDKCDLKGVQELRKELAASPKGPAKNQKSLKGTTG